VSTPVGPRASAGPRTFDHLPHDHGGPAWWDDLSVRPNRAVPETWPAVGVVAALSVSNVMTNRVLPRWAYVPWNIGVASGLVWWARTAGGCSGAELGLSRRHLLGGLRWGGAAAAAVAAVYAAGVAVPRSRAAFRDDRAENVVPLEVLWRVLVEIPFGTVPADEVAFRGVLPAMFRQRFAAEPNWAVRADLTASGLFGLWHILPASGLAEANPTLRELPSGAAAATAVAGSVAGTTAAGLLFTWLRNRSGSVLAPVMLHGAINGGAYSVAWALGRAAGRPPGRSWTWRRPIRGRIRVLPGTRRFGRGAARA